VEKKNDKLFSCDILKIKYYTRFKLIEMLGGDTVTRQKEKLEFRYYEIPEDRYVGLAEKLVFL